MTAEQLQVYFELDNLINREKKRFYAFSKPNIESCHLSVNSNTKSLVYSIYFINRFGYEAINKEYISKVFVDFETIYETLNKEFLNEIESDFRANLEKELAYAKNILQEVQDKLYKIDDQI